MGTCGGVPGSPVHRAFDVDTALSLPGTPCTSWATPSSASSAPTSSSSWCGPARPSPRTLCSSGSPWSEWGGLRPAAGFFLLGEGCRRLHGALQILTEAWCLQRPRAPSSWEARGSPSRLPSSLPLVNGVSLLFPEAGLRPQRCSHSCQNPSPPEGSFMGPGMDRRGSGSLSPTPQGTAPDLSV